MPVIRLKRAYEAAAKSDGARILIERLWPRGVKKTSLPLAAWAKEVAPTTGLRQWFSHDPSKWLEFQRRYTAELRTHAAELAPLLAAARGGTLTLIYSSHDAEHNNAVVLKYFLEGKLKEKAGKAA
ncbi:MAG: DUF488 domain-containing protein [Terriglobales bacterium]